MQDFSCQQDLSPIGTVVSLGARPAYHLVALQPTSEEAFRAACEKARAYVNRKPTKKDFRTFMEIQITVTVLT